MRVLVSGSGIAGLTLAHRLQRGGHDVVIVEIAPRPRGGGYMIDFFGSGYDVAERMGLLDELARIHYPIPRLTFMAPSGREKFSVAYPKFRKLFDNRHFNFLRGDLEGVLHATVKDRVPVRFGTTVEAITSDGGQVCATLSDGTSEKVDLLVGADGVHSQVRRLVFGDEARFKRFLGYSTAAFILDEYDTNWARDGAFCMLIEPHLYVGVYPIRGGRVATFFVHKVRRKIEDFSPGAARDELRAAYGGMGWIVPGLLEACEGVSDIYFDEVSQIEMPRWADGRVVLVGDSCQCVPLLAGQGASLAMAGAYVLAEEPGAGADVPAALARYERRVKPKVEEKQKAGRRMARWFVPESRCHLAVSEAVLRMGSWPLFSLVLKRWMSPGSILNS